MGKPELHKNSKRFGYGIDITLQTGSMTAKPVKPSQQQLHIGGIIEILFQSLSNDAAFRCIDSLAICLELDIEFRSEVGVNVLAFHNGK